MGDEVGRLKVVLEGEVDERSLKKQKTKIQDRLRNFGVDLKAGVTGKAQALGGGLADKLGGGLSGAMGKGGGKLMALGGGILAALGLILGALMVLKRVASSSLVFQKVMGNMMKSIKFILRPIGDIIGYALMPIMYVLRMVAKIIQAMWSPYRKSISQLMRAGNKYLKAGQEGKALQSFGLGLGYMMKPFMDLMIEGLKAAVPFVADVMVDVTKAIVGFGFDVLSTITRVITDVGVFFGNIFDSVFGTDIASTIREFGDGAEKLIIEQKDNMLGAIEGVREPMKTGMTGLLDSIKAEYTTAMDDMRDDLVAGANDLLPEDFTKDIDAGAESTKSLGERINEMVATLTTWKDFIQNDLTKIVDENVTSLTSLIGELTTLESDVRTKDVPAFQAMITSIKEVVTNLQTLWTDINTTFTNLNTQWDNFVWNIKFGLNALENKANDFIDLFKLGDSEYRRRPENMVEYQISDQKALDDYAAWEKRVYGDFISQNGNIHSISPQDTVVGFKGASPVGGPTYNIYSQLDPQAIADRVLVAVKSYIDDEVTRKVRGY